MNGPPEQFTQADSMQLQRLQQAQSQARQLLDSQQINDDEYAQFADQIMNRMMPLRERQQTSKRQAQDEAAQDASHQHAQQQAMEQQAAVYRAQGMPDRIVPVVDPLKPTRIAKLFEKRPGEWEEIKFEASREDEKKRGGDATVS